MLKYSRKVIEDYFNEAEPDINKFISKDMNRLVNKETPAYITLLKYPSMSFRGSSGHIMPIISLKEAVKELAVKAAFMDRRVFPLMESELSDTILELTILNEPKLIEVKSFSEYPKRIKVGRDGLVMEYNYVKAVLLPQVAVRRGWNEKEFLSFALLRVGVNPMDVDEKIKVYKFQAQVFREKEPGGRIIED